MDTATRRQSLRPARLDLQPVEAARGLRHLPGFVFLDSACDERWRSREPAGRNASISLIAANPERVIEGDIRDPSELRRYVDPQPGSQRPDQGLPAGGLFGYVEYEGRSVFGVYPEVLVYEHETERWFETGRLSEQIDLNAALSDGRPTVPLDFSAGLNREIFCALVPRARDYIAAGDIYQVNLSQRFQASWPSAADAFPLFERLREVSPAPQSGFLDLGGKTILSSSPELFLSMSGPAIRTRPIKGTRPRFREPGLDEKSAYDLITSSKEVAELIMITDLERNDLGRICEFGSVNATDLLKLERFTHVFHLVSTVEGLLRPDVTHVEALASAFPGGSITGAPKKRAMEIIRELEPLPRGVYTGAIGYFGFNGESQFSIAIRTAVIEQDLIHFHVGAGIVADSSPDMEYEETLHKAAGLLAAAQPETAPALERERPRQPQEPAQSSD